MFHGALRHAGAVEDAKGVLTAKKACVLAYRASRAGASGATANLVYPPGSSSTGNYSKHFDRVVGIKEEMEGEFYEFSMPCLQRWSLGRTEMICPATLVYKSIREDILGHTGFP